MYLNTSQVFQANWDSLNINLLDQNISLYFIYFFLLNILNSFFENFVHLYFDCALF